jgi:predicted DNA-binding transcriptional regulator AlpA
MSTKLLTTEQTAEYLGVSKAFLERDRWSGPTIQYVKVGDRAVRYRLCDLDDFITSRIQEAL